MDKLENKKLSELVDIPELEIPQKTKIANMSKDFWMPDQSCRVCYECDTQFTMFNRRHHCRLCGRVFCAKCTENSVPSPSEDGDKIRVCKYCYKQWENGGATVDDTISVSSLVLSRSPSATSLVSTSSSCTGNSTISSVGSNIYSTRTYKNMAYSSVESPRHCARMDPVVGKKDLVTCREDTDSVDNGVIYPNQFGYCMARSDDEDDDYSVYKPHSETKQDETYSDVSNYNEIDHIYGPHHKIHYDREKSTTNSMASTMLPDNFHIQDFEGEQKLGEELEISRNDTDESEAPPLYELDFENNGELWLPPGPADEEDDTESDLFDDDDDSVGEWGYLRSSSSFGSSEYSNRDRSVEVHRNAMKNVVNGHFKELIVQLLQAENLPVGELDDKESWLEIITSLSWEAATHLKPDTSKGGGMDPGGYVKVKCIACGRRSESIVVKGVVCKKNVSNRRMTSKIYKPRFLILGGALEYQRVTNHLSSFDTLLQQEMDHLKMAVAKIDSQHPNVLLVEKSVSGIAQDYLLAKNISLVLNIKKPLLERIARCTGAQIVPSIDHLTSQKLGYCDSFHVDKFLEEYNSVGQGGKKHTKTLMFFEGCPKPLGCTILLKGASSAELKKVKHIVQYGIFAAYHLALETSFLADEGASLPELPLKSPIRVALPNKPTSTDSSISTIPGYTVPSPRKQHGPRTSSESNRSNHNMLSDTHQNGTSYNHAYNENTIMLAQDLLEAKRSTPKIEAKILLPAYYSGNSELLSPEQDSNSQNEMGFLKEEFPVSSPLNHQSILVSLSTRCVWKGTVCERAHLFRIKYYGSFDKPLGRFLQDHLFDQSYRCRACEMPSEAHIHCYTHQQGSLSISVKRLPELILPGEREGKIWMWHRCLRCPRIDEFPPATKRVVMSDAAWGLSLGKFLELSFSNHAAASRVANCGHSLHRDCLRFYGFGRMIACFRYASIDVHSVHVPPSKLEFNYANQEWISKEADEVRSMADILFAEVYHALHQISDKITVEPVMKVPESRHQSTELEGILQKEREEVEESLHQVLNKDINVGKPAIDILAINKLRRQLIFHSYLWDQRLIHLASLNNKSKINATSNISSNQIGDTGHIEKDLNNSLGSKKTEFSLSPTTKTADESVILGPLKIVKKVLMDNLSDTFDAVWSGESHPNSVTLDSPTVTEPVKGEKGLEIFKGKNSTRWVGPFLKFYHSFDRKLSLDVQNLLSFCEYNPIYIMSFRELIRRGGARMLLPVGINDTVVPVYDDEPTSIIAYTLVSPDYHIQISRVESPLSSPSLLNLHSLNTTTENSTESLRDLGSTDESIMYPKALHPRVSFADEGPLGKVKYVVTCYYAKKFEALRRACCPSEIDFVRSLSRCKKWGAQGGKSNVFFAKTLDDRFIIKQVTKTELESFIEFAPEYFKYLSESISTGSPTCLAKILGIYQLTSKHLKGGKELRMDVLVMENLMFRRNVTRLYDLKGSCRSRYNPDCNGVLLDQNLIEAMPTSPIFVGNKAKRLLERAVWNDTAFLASIDVMDYSLLVGVDEKKHELVVGIIDFMRQYTWDKHLETWVKASGILGGPKNTSPTVISPKQYKKRFRKAISSYFLMVPDQWSPSDAIQSDISEENLQLEKTAG